MFLFLPQLSSAISITSFLCSLISSTVPVLTISQLFENCAGVELLDRDRPKQIRWSAKTKCTIVNWCAENQVSSHKLPTPEELLNLAMAIDFYTPESVELQQILLEKLTGFIERNVSMVILKPALTETKVGKSWTCTWKAYTAEWKGDFSYLDHGVEAPSNYAGREHLDRKPVERDWISKTALIASAVEIASGSDEDGDAEFDGGRLIELNSESEVTKELTVEVEEPTQVTEEVTEETEQSVSEMDLDEEFVDPNEAAQGFGAAANGPGAAQGFGAPNPRMQQWLVEQSQGKVSPAAAPQIPTYSKPLTKAAAHSAVPPQQIGFQVPASPQAFGQQMDFQALARQLDGQSFNALIGMLYGQHNAAAQVQAATSETPAELANTGHNLNHPAATPANTGKTQKQKPRPVTPVNTGNHEPSSPPAAPAKIASTKKPRAVGTIKKAIIPQAPAPASASAKPVNTNNNNQQAITPKQTRNNKDKNTANQAPKAKDVAAAAAAASPNQRITRQATAKAKANINAEAMPPQQLPMPALSKRATRQSTAKANGIINSEAVPRWLPMPATYQRTTRQSTAKGNGMDALPQHLPMPAKDKRNSNFRPAHAKTDSDGFDQFVYDQPTQQPKLKVKVKGPSTGRAQQPQKSSFDIEELMARAQ